ncbi:MAG: NADH-quinone oxidoreductase subunit N [Gemmatimonadaceae bacterium]
MRFDLTVPWQLSAALGPDLLLAGGAMLLLLWCVWRPESAGHQRSVGAWSIALCVLTIAAVVWYGHQQVTSGPGIIAVDSFRWAADLIFLGATIIALMLAMDYNEREHITVAESHVLVLLATSGAMLLAASRDLMMIFLGVELMSISVYVLAGLNRRSAVAAEAALKYFLLGAFSTGFLLYGIALLYGVTGTTNLAAIGQWASVAGRASSPMLLVGIALLLVGFAFKVAAVPFHMWTPDVYDGAPTPYSAYMAAAVKAGAFAAFFRVWLEAFPLAAPSWHGALWWIAAITMVVGNLVALAQSSIKRLLAYSSIAHAGYILVALVSGTALGAASFLFYLTAYTLATMGAFAVVIALGQAGEIRLAVTDYSGLWRVRPWLALAMAVFMLALLGFPLAGGMGFFAKWYVLQAALRAPQPQTRLAVVLVLTSFVSAGYYLRVLKVMFMNPRAADMPDPMRVPALTQIVIGFAAGLLLVFGILPSPALEFSRWGVSVSGPMAETPIGPPLTRLDR